ncbi:hypothetical protein Pmani_034506 [Petrolisthes manimaculis]|uniref:Protein krueppel n=1 Tax=Petrolisthes manimaculis TaxID=1843537 RepID=A0AAE1TRG5_9EUCA|nr:hypothetical protein Pmani_034506 [Petrolisthes manimaculis]
MENVPNPLRLWKIKLEEIVSLANQLDDEDRKPATEFWFAAFDQIQALWRKSSPKHIKQHGLQEIHPSEETTVSPEMTIDSSETAKRKEEFRDDEDDDEEEEEEEEGPDSDDEMRFHIDNDGRTSVQEEDFVQDDVTKLNEPSEVQSVHLIVSADPVLVPKMNKYKKVYKNEITGKMETAYQCEKCTKQCRTALALYKHRSSHFKRLDCPICHQRLSNKHALNAHKRTHTGERPYQCTKCSSRFTTRGNLARHNASHAGEKPWQCSLCGKRYTEKKSLKIHMRTHTGEKPYACSLCHKRFTQSGSLQAHMLIHTNQFAHLCDICGRSFRQRSQLVTHHLRHEGVRPFSCPECDRRFTTKGDMERHLRTHTGERPFTCDVCGSSFARPQTLQEHKNRHFNFKPYVCKICGKDFHELAACSRHVKGLHGRETGNSPASGSIVRLASSEQQQDSGKQGILLAHLNVKDKNKIIKDRENLDEVDVKEEDLIKDEEEIETKHHIFVMQTTDHEETELITIAEPPNSLDKERDGAEAGVECGDCDTLVTVARLKDHASHCSSQQEVSVQSVTEWLVQDQTSSPGSTMEVSIEDDTKRSISCVQETNEALECVEEVDAANLNHAVTISEDGSITSVPLSQLAPLHLQLENDYMVVLSSNTRTEEGSSRTFQP